MALDPTNQYQKQFGQAPQGDPEDSYWKDPCTGKVAISGQWQFKYLRRQGLLATPVTAAPDIVRQVDSISQTPWLFNSTINKFYSYDDPESIKVKVNYSASKGMAGTMVWLMHMDYQNELLSAIHGTSVGDGNSETKPAKACLKRRGKHRGNKRGSCRHRRSLQISDSNAA
ncbi:hypothetical protein GGH97_004367 [Coemansia sp. RSA 475]|nr:hypothetical protein GGH97_004367 [Coemansia sp. RSA 475]